MTQQLNQYPATHWGYIDMQTSELVNPPPAQPSPSPSPQSARPPKPPKLSNVNKVLNYLQHTYFLMQDSYGVFYLIPNVHLYPNLDGKSLLLEPAQIASKVKADFVKWANHDVSDRHVKDALDIAKTEFPNSAQVGNGRTCLSSTGERHIWFGGQIWVFGPGYENVVIARQHMPIWQPLNCLPFSSHNVQGHHAWRPEPIQNLSTWHVLPTDREWLIYTFMVLTLLPERDQVALELTGESRRHISQLLQSLKHLLDPCRSEALVQQPLSRMTELDSLAWQHHVIALDDIEDPISNKIQRRMLALLKGNRLDWNSRRQTDQPSFIMTKRIWLFGGIVPVVTQQELRERTLSLEMPPSDEDQGIPMQYLATSQGSALDDTQHAVILSSLLTLLGKAHAAINRVQLNRQVTSEWEDFCRVGMIVSQAATGSDAVFWEQYESYQHERNREVIEEDPVAYALFQYFTATKATDIEEKPVGIWLGLIAPFRPVWSTDRDWPSHPRGMGAAFKRAAPLLKFQGFVCRSNGKRGSTCRWAIGPEGIASRHY